MKRTIYIGSVKKDIESLPKKAKERIMTALTVVNAGLDLNPKDFKYMPVVGTGCYELRLKIEAQYRVFYVAKFYEATYVLHAFVKKTQQTPKPDIALGADRYKALMKYRQEKKYDKKD